ncbi:hypothetical protein Ahy_A01g003304 [Arachis hypogaea]|uniref:Uncharacterized protein n=1 Tax=Arachis hypogaea TaxID=3818 RepID=A0A445ET75_ARAHY|nr:hypothetical protein Ahy_A01g003304 [Arachis hypogaea]
MEDSSTSSTSQSHLEKTQPFHFRATFETQDIQLVANIRKLHQHTINSRSRISRVNKAIILKRKWQRETNLEEINMSEEKKTIVRDLGLSCLMHIPPLRVHHQVLRELANNFKLGENRLETGYGSFKITPRKIGDALGINATGDLFPQKVDYKKLSEDDKVIFRRFQDKTLKSLTDEMMDIGVDGQHNGAKLGGGGHVLTFMVKGITDYKEKTKKAIDVCLFALMIIYIHLSKNKGKKKAERPPKSWIANWSKEQLVERMSAETEEILYVLNNDCLPSRKRKKSQGDSDSDLESESTDETQSKKKKVVVEHSSPEEDQYYDGERYEIGSEDLDELLRGIDEKSAAEGYVLLGCRTKLTCDRQKVAMSPLKRKKLYLIKSCYHNLGVFC